MIQPLLADDFNAVPLPDFFPERLRRACAGKRISYRVPASVRERMQVPEDIDTADWAEKYRCVTAIDAHPGRWRNDLVPHAVKPMRLTSAPYIRKLYLCWPERAGKTNVVTNAAMRQVDRGIESGNIFWLMPSEHEAKKAIGERVIEALKATPRTARLLSRYADDTTRTIIRFRHGPRLFAAWAGSAASVSSFFGALNIGDEIDKVDTTGVGKETDILTLLFKRGRDRDDSKFLIVSTPAQGYIYKGTMGAQQVLQYHGKCPHCGGLVHPGEENVIIPPGASAEDIAHGLVPVAMACPRCGAEWSEHDRAIAYHDGDWVVITGESVARPESVGMHMTAYLLPTVPLKEIAEAIVRAKAGGEVEKKALENGYNCRDYIPENKADRQESYILRLIDPHMPRQVVPRDTNSILIFADTQKHGYFYEVIAFGWGRELENWVIDRGYVELSDHLVKLQDRDWFDADKVRYRARAGFIDSGGGADPNHPKHSRTREVYDFCIDNPFWRPLKGRQRQSTPVSWTRLDFYPGSDGRKVAIPGGLVLYTIDTTFYKNTLDRKLKIDPGNPGACHFHCGLTKEELEAWSGPHPAQQEGLLRWQDYAKQMCAEVQDERGYWINPGKKANHHWDLGVYRYAGADILYLGDERRPEQLDTPESKPQKHGIREKSRRW